jgi:FMN-dependent NADH-azoreductase
VKLLEIQSSPRGESSDSITLTKSFIEACKSYNTSIVVDTLNVWHERLPEFDYDAIGAKYKAVKQETMTEAESYVWERIQSLMQRFQNADRIILGTPMWNFGLPYKLKQLIDLVAQRNYLLDLDPACWTRLIPDFSRGSETIQPDGKKELLRRVPQGCGRAVPRN